MNVNIGEMCKCRVYILARFDTSPPRPLMSRFGVCAAFATSQFRRLAPCQITLRVGTDKHVSKIPLGHVRQGADVVPGLWEKNQNNSIKASRESQHVVNIRYVRVTSCCVHFRVATRLLLSRGWVSHRY